MTMLPERPRGGLVEDLDGAPRVLILRNREIERFEDKHGGIFDLWAGFTSETGRPNWRQVRDLLELALVGGGLDSREAARVLTAIGPDRALFLYQLAQSVIAVAFMPHLADEADKAGAEAPETGKKDPAGDGACA